MKNKKSPQTLAKFIAYILERRPDEFGLVVDSEGYIKIKELLKALNEEKGVRHVRRSHLNEILYSIAHPPFEIADNRIRAKNRDRLPRPDVARDLADFFQAELIKRLQCREVELLGAWHCPGQDRNFLFKWLQISRGRPNEDDIAEARAFAASLKIV